MNFIKKIWLINLVAKRIKYCWLRIIAPSLLSVFVQLKFIIFSYFNLLSNNVSEDVVVSLTSYPPRFADLHITIKSLLLQDIRPGKLILWISEEDFNLLPAKVISLSKFGLTINLCKDYRSYKKLLPTLNLYPTEIIVTADDDLYYWNTWLSELLKFYNIHKGYVVCHRAHRVRYDESGFPLPYNDWEIEVKEGAEGTDIFPTTGAGVLYPPGALLHEMAVDFETANLICPFADDIWYYWTIRLNGVVAKKIEKNRYLFQWGRLDDGLFLNNVINKKNDEQFSKMFQLYGNVH